jgi:uncharacterized membrane protein
VIRDPLAILGVLAAAVWLAVRLERAHRAFAAASAGLLAIFLAALGSNLGLVPSAGRTYDAVFLYVAPAAIVLLLLRVDLRAIAGAGPAVLAGFLLASVGTAVGCVVGAILLRERLGEPWWTYAGMMAATCIGGSVNFVAVGQEYRLDSARFAGANAADVAATAIWVGATILLPRALRRLYPPLKRGNLAVASGTAEEPPRPPGAADLALLAALATGALFASSLLTARFRGVPSVLWVTTIALVLGQVPPIRRIPGIEEAGTFLVYLFLAAIGATCDLTAMLASGLEIFLFACLAIVIHGLVVFGAGRLLRLPVEVLALASNSTVGGPATAMALARSQGWTGLVLPGVLSGLLGYAVGTYAGVAVCEALRPQ